MISKFTYDPILSEIKTTRTISPFLLHRVNLTGLIELYVKDCVRKLERGEIPDCKL